MKRFTIAIFSLTILAIFFVAGCFKMTETEIKPSDEQGVISYEQQETKPTGDETINKISNDISDIGVIDDDIDTQNLNNLAQDLNDIDW